MANSLSMRLHYAMDFRSLPTIAATLPIDSMCIRKRPRMSIRAHRSSWSRRKRGYSTISLCARCRELRREPGQIEVRIDAIGLNYKDAMKLLGVLTPQNLRGTCFGTAVGMEGIGVVTRADPRSRFGIGDVVLVSVPNMFSRYLTLDPADGVVERLTRDVAPGLAGSFIPYLTAHYGLVCAARLGEDETILVHGAAGGTGLAAVHVARHLGARVIGSAGSEERRDFARAAGAHHTVNSRTVNFVDDVMRLTDGRGADVIYTSLPGEALRQNLKAAAEFGRIVDIGKADIYSNGAIELGPFDHNLQYFAVDVDRMFNLPACLHRTARRRGHRAAGRRNLHPPARNDV